MAISNAFGTTVQANSPTDPTVTSGDKKVVSDFITVASLTNFSAMTGAIATGWGGLRQVSGQFDSNWVPFLGCLLFALVSLLSSEPGKEFRMWGPAAFIAALNALTLFAAVLGAAEVAVPGP